MQPLISIIIPTFNRLNFLKITIKSLIEQEFLDWECIIVDDSSNLETTQFLKEISLKDARFKMYSKPIHLLKGPSSSRNFGFTKSNGKWIQWFDSDDVYLKDALKLYSQYFHNQVDAVVAKLEKYNFENNFKISENTICSDNLILDYFTNKVAFFVCCPMWNRNFLIKQKVLFDEKVSNLEDWDFNLRMLYQSPKITVLDKILIRYRIHQESLSHQILRFNKIELISEIETRKKHFLLLKSKKTDSQNIKDFMHKRLKFLLRSALLSNNNAKWYLFCETIKFQISSFFLFEMLKTLVGFTFFILMKKGYKMFK